MDNCRQRLLAGCVELGLALSKDRIDTLLSFIELIAKWNKAYNLTAIKSQSDMVVLHLLDSLTVIPYLQGNQIADIGTGGGLPGIPLAICLPELSFTLLDSNAKKTRFVRQAVLELKLGNVEVIHSRVEDFVPAQPFETVITRAFAELTDIVRLTRHLLNENGLLLAMKGQSSQAELTKAGWPATVVPVKVPFIDAERNLVLIKT